MSSVRSLSLSLSLPYATAFSKGERRDGHLLDTDAGDGRKDDVAPLINLESFAEGNGSSKKGRILPENLSASHYTALA